MPLDEPGEHCADSVREIQPLHELVLGDESKPCEPLQMRGHLTRFSSRLDEALALLLGTVSIRPLGDERFGARRRADDLIHDP